MRCLAHPQLGWCAKWFVHLIQANEAKMPEQKKTTRLHASKSGVGPLHDRDDERGRCTIASVQTSSRIETAFLGEKQVASLLNVSEQWLRKCRANGTGPTWCKMEGCIRYPIEGLKTYITETQRDFTGQVKPCPSSGNGEHKS